MANGIADARHAAIVGLEAQSGFELQSGRPTTMQDQASNQSRDANGASGYWATNIRIIVVCLVIWALVSFGFGILLRPLLAGISVGGTDLGFWFAQQGSILVFLVLIFFYAWRMNRLDREHSVDEE
jgi:putative solute:sodium symporter small subunit